MLQFKLNKQKHTWLNLSMLCTYYSLGDWQKRTPWTSRIKVIWHSTRSYSVLKGVTVAATKPRTKKICVSLLTGRGRTGTQHFCLQHILIVSSWKARSLHWCYRNQLLHCSGGASDVSRAKFSLSHIFTRYIMLYIILLYFTA